MIPWLLKLHYHLNWISRIFLNLIIFWIESWVKQYWIEYWINHFLAKFKHWIESDWVSDTPREVSQSKSGWLFVWPYSTVHQVSRPGVSMDRASAVQYSVINRQKPAVIQFFLLLDYKYHVLKTSFIIYRSYSTQKKKHQKMTRQWRRLGLKHRLCICFNNIPPE